MKRLSTIALIGFALNLAAVPALRGEETGPETLIARARTVVLTPDPGRDAITKALVDILSASLQVLPQKDQTKECRSRVEEARKTLAQGELFSEQAYANLGLAYKEVSGGKAWKIPEELTSPGKGAKGIEQATKLCAKLLDSALAAYKAGRSEESVRDLLGMVILVVTPIEVAR